MQPGSTIDGLKGCEVEPRVAFHYGIPSGSTISAYDSIQKILALSTRYLSNSSFINYPLPIYR